MKIIKKFKIGKKEYAIAFTYPWDYKICGVCGKIIFKGNYCTNCASSQVITRMRQNDKSPDNATEPPRLCFKYY